MACPWTRRLRTLEIGKAELLKDGSDVAIIAIGNMVYPALEAAKRLAADGISAAVVNARFVKPLDERADPADRQVDRQDRDRGGACAARRVRQRGARMPRPAGLTGIKSLRIGLPDCYIEHGTQALLRKKYGLDAEGIYAKVREFVERSRLKAVPPVKNIRTMDV